LIFAIHVDRTFDNFGEPGIYGALVMRKGYTFPSKSQTNLEFA